MHPLALALALLFACHVEDVETARPAPTTPAPVVRESVAERLDLNLPGPAAAPSYTFTSAEGRSPVAYPLPDGRVLVHDGYRDRIAVIEPVSGRRIELGEALLLAVPRLGWLIVPKGDGPPRYCDVEPGGAKLRTLWEAPRARDGEVTLVELAGVERGAPLMITRRIRRTPDGKDVREPVVELVRLRGAGAEVRSLPLPVELWVPGGDAVRGRKLLLLEDSTSSAGWNTPFSAEVFVADLDGGQLIRLGSAIGDWSHSTAVPHPYVAVRWRDHDSRVHDVWWDPECVNTVEVASLLLVPCRLPARPRG